MITKQEIIETVQQSLARPDNVEIERHLETLTGLMDNRFRIPVLGWRFGMNAVIDLIPGVGDVATTLIAVYILGSAVRYRVPKVTLLRMGLNIVIYFTIGLIPWLGDAFDAWWKPNVRNLQLLRERAVVSAAEVTRGQTSDWLFVGIIIGVVLVMLAATFIISFSILKYLVQNIGQN